MVVIALVLFLAAPPLCAAKAKKKTDDPLIRKWWERPKIVRELGLTEDQLAKVKEIYDGGYDGLVEKRWNYKEQKRGLEDLLSRADLDEEQINQQTGRVREARAGLEETITRMQTAMMKELSPEQRKKLTAILENWKEDVRHKKIKHRK
jgi:Spy/CpxP family protein refolding chaperone